MLTLLKKRPPTVKKSYKIRFSKTECFLMKMCLLFQILGSRRPRMKEFFVYLAKTRHLDILYKKSEGKMEVFSYRNYSGG